MENLAKLTIEKKILYYLITQRAARGISQKEMAELAGMKPWVLREIELGKQPLDIGTAEKLAKALQITWSDLIDRVNHTLSFALTRITVKVAIGETNIKEAEKDIKLWGFGMISADEALTCCVERHFATNAEYATYLAGLNDSGIQYKVMYYDIYKLDENQ